MFLPIAINISHLPVLIIGGGRVGFHKATVLRRFTTVATVVSPQFHKGFETLGFTLKEKKYAPTDLDGFGLVYICTENHALNLQIKADCEQRGLLAGVCDAPLYCDFISPAIFQNDGMCIAVTSNARDVHRSIRIRDRIQKLMTENPELLL